MIIRLAPTATITPSRTATAETPDQDPNGYAITKNGYTDTDDHSNGCSKFDGHPAQDRPAVVGVGSADSQRDRVHARADIQFFQALSKKIKPLERLYSSSSC